MLDLSRRRLLYERCNPEQPLAATDDRNVDIDAMPHGPRGPSWVVDVAERLELGARERVCEFFSGLRGAGKSTELRRLRDRLERPDGANLLVVLVDADELVNLNDEVDLPDLLLVLLFAFERAVLQLEGRDTTTPVQDGVVQRLLHWFRETEASVGEVKVSSGIELALELKTRPSLRELFRRRAASELNRLQAEVVAEMEALRRRAQQRGRSDVLLILDSLEKLQGTSLTWQGVLASAEVVVKHLRSGVSLPVHTLYTVPPGLLMRMAINELHFLPMVKLHQRDGSAPDEAGYAACHQMVVRRVPEADLAFLLGADPEARIRRLIRASGGYPRELVRLLQSLVAAGDRAARDFEEIIAKAHRNVAGMVVTSQMLQVLALVHVDKTLNVDEGLMRHVDELLSNNLILRYQNHTLWYDVHPALENSIELKLAVQRLRAARSVA